MSTLQRLAEQLLVTRYAMLLASAHNPPGECIDENWKRWLAGLWRSVGKIEKRFGLVGVTQGKVDFYVKHLRASVAKTCRSVGHSGKYFSSYDTETGVRVERQLEPKIVFMGNSPK